MRETPKLPDQQIGDIVYCADMAWVVTGLSMKLGYDVFLWSIHLSRTTYGSDTDPGCPWMGGTDVDQIVVREDEVELPQARHDRELKDAQERVRKAEEELQRLKDRQQELEQRDSTNSP